MEGGRNLLIKINSEPFLLILMRIAIFFYVQSLTLKRHLFLFLMNNVLASVGVVLPDDTDQGLLTPGFYCVYCKVDVVQSEVFSASLWHPVSVFFFFLKSGLWWKSISSEINEKCALWIFRHCVKKKKKVIVWEPRWWCLICDWTMAWADEWAVSHSAYVVCACARVSRSVAHFLKFLGRDF